MDILNSIESSLFSSSYMDRMLNDIQFANRFTVMLTSPKGWIGLFDAQDDSFRVKTFNIPNSTMTTADRTYQGIRTKIVSTRETDSFSIVFYDSEFGRLREKFHTWENLIFDRDTGKLGYYKDYIADQFTLKIISTENKETQKFITFSEVYPISIGDITYDRDAKDTLVEFPVTFTFKRMQIVKDNKESKEDSFIDKIKETFTF